ADPVSGRRQPAGKVSESEMAKREEKKAKKLALPDIAQLVAGGAQAFKPVPDDQWPFIVDMLREREYDYAVAITLCLERRGASPSKSKGRVEAFAEYADRLTLKERGALLWEVRFWKSARPWWEYNQSKLDRTAQMIVTQLDIDWRAAYERHLGEIRERRRRRIEAARLKEARKTARGGKLSGTDAGTAGAAGDGDAHDTT